MDAVIVLHQEFQDTCLKGCLLSNSHLLRLLNKIVTVCMLFASYMEQVSQEFEIGNTTTAAATAKGATGGGLDHDSLFSAATTQSKYRRSNINQGAARRERVESQTEAVHLQTLKAGFPQTVAAFSKHLDNHIEQFMKQLWEDSKAQYQSYLSNLITRLVSCRRTCICMREIEDDWA